MRRDEQMQSAIIGQGAESPQGSPRSRGVLPSKEKGRFRAESPFWKLTQSSVGAARVAPLAAMTELRSVGQRDQKKRSAAGAVPQRMDFERDLIARLHRFLGPADAGLLACRGKLD